MGRFDTFGWSELISFIAVVISFATITTSLVSRSKKNGEIDTKNEQKIFDKLRLKRIEETQDHCQACRVAKQSLETNGG